METYTAEYEFGNLLYKIEEREEIHNLLGDAEYFQQYITENAMSIEVSLLDNEKEGETRSEQFSWTPRTTKLLLSAYNDKKGLFRDPRMKKKNLWVGIKNVFLDHGYHVSEDILDKKFRNMKSHFKVVKDNAKKSKTGQGRVSWEYFEAMDVIFEEDKTINTDEVISSMRMAVTSELSEDKENILPTTSVNVDSQPGTSRREPQPGTSKSEPQPEQNHTPAEETSIPLTGKSLAQYRTVMMDHDDRRLALLERIAQTLDEIKDVQIKRNNLMERYLNLKENKN
ncbi:uncharacterized protein LOC126892431 [Diabrotica virgifera virgifera]|uniref:Myb/SANT-like DNA-binding domain-containing protein n=1 Tax=Diabrotica virgifera virgifera TaxID=50390 RepID=A0ABM5L652_DIAVI|nr:uncharacterized protein LOC126892431 [Diabrotica virgifera virgifera]